jgi:hypothetical protein
MVNQKLPSQCFPATKPTAGRWRRSSEKILEPAELDEMLVREHFRNERRLERRADVVELAARFRLCQHESEAFPEGVLFYAVGRAIAEAGIPERRPFTHGCWCVEVDVGVFHHAIRFVGQSEGY